jgi:hypothetical protein
MNKFHGTRSFSCLFLHTCPLVPDTHSVPAARLPCKFITLLWIPQTTVLAMAGGLLEATNEIRSRAWQFLRLRFPDKISSHSVLSKLAIFLTSSDNGIFLRGLGLSILSEPLTRSSCPSKNNCVMSIG